MRRGDGFGADFVPGADDGSQAKFGQTIKVNTATHIAGVLDFAGGAVGTLTTSFDVYNGQVPCIEIYGSEGTLSVPDPNTFGGDVKLRRAGEKEFVEQPLAFPHAENVRGIGVAELAAAIRATAPVVPAVRWPTMFSI